MTTPPDKNKRRIFSLLLPLVVITIVLGYFQLFYKSTPVKQMLAENARILRHDAQARTVHFSPNDSFLASGSVDKTVRIWEVSTGQLKQTLTHPEGITYLSYTPDGSKIVTSSYDGIVRVWDIATGKLEKQMDGSEGAMWTVAVSADGNLVAAGGEDKQIFLWDLASGQLLKKMKGHDRNIWSVRFTPDAQNIISSSFDNTVRVWSVASGKLMTTIEAHSEAVVDVNISADGKTMASTSDDKTVRLWRLPDFHPLHKVKVPEHIQAAAFSKDGRWLLVGGRDKPMVGEFLQEIFGDSHFNRGISLRLIDVSKGNVVQTFDDHFNDVNDVAWSNGGLLFATASEDHTVRIYRMRTVQSHKSAADAAPATELSESLPFAHMLLTQ